MIRGKVIGKLMDTIVHLLSGSHGQYVPKVFVEIYFTEDGVASGNVCDSDGVRIGESDSHKNIIESVVDCFDPNSETYWDSWQEIMDNVYVYSHLSIDKRYMIIQNGSLYAIPVKELNDLTEEEADVFWQEIMW